MQYIDNILFVALVIGGTALFWFNARKIARNIHLGKPLDRSDNKGERLRTMIRVALGQSKMVTRPVAGIMHIFVYVGFVIINIELIEIVIDGIFGTHRVLSFMGGFYTFLIASFEVLGALVILGCVVFLLRRNLVRVKRFTSPELKGWPASDANLILTVEITLMFAFLFMNAADYRVIQLSGSSDVSAAAFPVSAFLSKLYGGAGIHGLELAEQFCWWYHIVGIFFFLNYLPYSKHLHILLAFPNTYFSNLKPKGRFSNDEVVTREVKLMLDPSAAAPPASDQPTRFGAKEVTDLSWKQLLDAYSCTECGRCTSSCPANLTGKKLSPRKIMMDTRDRLEEVGKNIDQHGEFKDDGKSLLGDYITAEELWACNTCNACVQECPVNIDPLSIIVDMRRYLVMEQSAAPNELNMMFTNMENNGAPWQFSPADRLNWKND